MEAWEVTLEPPRRITEPFLKGHYALWLAQHGVSKIAISVDGAEPQAAEIKDILCAAGCSYEATVGSAATFAGEYAREGFELTVTARPGADIVCRLSDGRSLIAECKGERTQRGVSAGTDLVGVNEAIGQLISRASDEEPDTLLALVLPWTKRVAGFAERVTQNPFLRRIPVFVSLLDASGRVTEIGLNLPFNDEAPPGDSVEGLQAR